MASISSRQEIEKILRKISNDHHVSLDERILINRCAEEDSQVSCQLKKAKFAQNKLKTNHPVDNLINDLELGSPDPDTVFNPAQQDLGDWFLGAPSWLSRS